MAKKPFVPFWKKFGGKETPGEESAEKKVSPAKYKRGEASEGEGKPKMKKFAAGGLVARGSGCAVKGNTFTKNG